MSTNLWLDDERKPPSFSDCQMTWEIAKTAEEAIELLKGGKITFASLDHDLADEHYQVYFKAIEAGLDVDTSRCKEKTGLDVLDWMQEHDVWPEDGVRIHTMNVGRKAIMLQIVYQHYGQTFQYQFAGTHAI